MTNLYPRRQRLEELQEAKANCTTCSGSGGYSFEDAKGLHWETCDCERAVRGQQNLLARFTASRITPHQVQECTFESFTVKTPGEQRALDTVKEYAANSEWPGNLLLHGQVGRGKTHLAIACGVALLDTGTQVLFWSVPAMLAELRRGFDRSREQRSDDDDDLVFDACVAEILILDDLESEKASGWTAEQLFLIVDQRTANGSDTIVTTNFSPESLAATGSIDQQRIWSRLIDKGQSLYVPGPNHRLINRPKLRVVPTQSMSVGSAS
jgi:DNA replication protein DnaC